MSGPSAGHAVTPAGFLGAVDPQPDAVLPAGFVAGAATAGIKPSGRPDLAVVAVTTPAPATAAGLFTTNLVAAAPVRLSRGHLAATGGRARAVVVTSGSANAATGPEGEADQADIAAALAGALGCSTAETLCASTGLIGSRLPVPAIAAALQALVPAGLGAEPASLAAVAQAIMTTDRRPKLATTTLALPEADGFSARQVRVTGVAKGVGMIHPRLATMITLLLTDASADATVLAGLLREASAATFEQLSVDGDTSTNDTVLLLASGAAGAGPVRPGTREAAALREALTEVCRSLARQQAADGEGATTLITCRAAGAADIVDARAVSRAVISSSLVKAAVHGRDPNWGRVAAAAGNARRPDGSPVDLRPERLTVAIAGSPVFAGAPMTFERAVVSAAMAPPEVVIELDLGIGEASAEAWGCDLTEAYVRENAEYST